LLYAIEDYAIYGYRTASAIKVLILMEVSDKIIKDQDVRAVRILFNFVLEIQTASRCLRDSRSKSIFEA
jgi:hypothetical protein